MLVTHLKPVPIPKRAFATLMLGSYCSCYLWYLEMLGSHPAHLAMLMKTTFTFSLFNLVQFFGERKNWPQVTMDFLGGCKISAHQRSVKTEHELLGMVTGSNLGHRDKLDDSWETSPCPEQQVSSGLGTLLFGFAVGGWHSIFRVFLFPSLP